MKNLIRKKVLFYSFLGIYFLLNALVINNSEAKNNTQTSVKGTQNSIKIINFKITPIPTATLTIEPSNITPSPSANTNPSSTEQTVQPTPTSVSQEPSPTHAPPNVQSDTDPSSLSVPPQPPSEEFEGGCGNYNPKYPHPDVCLQ